MIRLTSPALQAPFAVRGPIAMWSRMAWRHLASGTSSASRLRIQSPVASELALFFVVDHPSHGQSTTRAPAAAANEGVPSVLPESKTTTSSARWATDFNSLGRLSASLRVMTTTLREGASCIAGGRLSSLGSSTIG